MTQANQHATNILDSVDDKLIAKRKFKRTVISSIILSVIVVLSAVIISLASININIQPSFMKNADGYAVYLNNEYSKHFGETHPERYEAFMEEYNSLFTTNVLAGMFTGKLSKYQISKPGNNFYTSSGELVREMKDNLGSNYIQISFNGPQTLKYKNGSNYRIAAYKKADIKFEDCYLKLDSNDDSKLTFYVAAYQKGGTLKKKL